MSSKETEETEEKLLNRNDSKYEGLQGEAAFKLLKIIMTRKQKAVWEFQSRDLRERYESREYQNIYYIWRFQV